MSQYSENEKLENSNNRINITYLKNYLKEHNKEIVSELLETHSDSNKFRNKEKYGGMFSTKQRLIEKTGYNGVGRYDYLKQLCAEFEKTSSTEAKEQVLANLANFAYDPINYNYFRQLRIIDLFLNVLSCGDTTLIRFAIGGICNLCSDPINKEYIFRNQGVRLVSTCLSSSDEATVLSAITTLMFLITETSRNEIVTPLLKETLVAFSNSTNNRFKNLAIIFLADHFGEGTIETETS